MSKNPKAGDTPHDVPVAAISTARGRGGIGIVRVSGSRDDIAGFARALFPGWNPVARHASLLSLRDAAGDLVDRGIVIWFPGPRSYTGEDVLEFQGHGGSAVLALALERILQVGVPWGVRIAEPGEYTRRAFLNGRIDLAQAEAVADLIDAESGLAARAATRSLSGEFSRRVRALVESLEDLRAQVEATLDFSDEEIDFIDSDAVRGRMDGIEEDLAALRKACGQGTILRDGLRVAIAGSPNVGKSSLMNALSGEQASIVTAIPGTTRDPVHRDVLLSGVRVHLVDTAGMRETADPIEEIGVERARGEADLADLVVWVADATDAATRGGAPQAGGRCLRVLNKVDLRPDSVWEGALRVSARTGEGLPELSAAILKSCGWAGSGSGVFLARQRHLHAIARAAESLAAARANLEGGFGAELFAEELRAASAALGEVTGQVSADDLLGRIFSTFCIGK